MRGAAPKALRKAAATGAAPLVWTFDGDFATCLADLEDALRRAIAQLGGVARLVVAIDVSLPALQRRVQAGDAVQPAWREFLARVSQRYGLPGPPKVRYLPAPGPLATLVILYRS